MFDIFIVWDLECRALGDALFLDVNTFFHDGREAAINALGHEMHHFYLSKVFDAIYKEDIIDCAVLPLVNNMREGVADLINKKEMPLKSLTPYGRQMLEIYNADYENSPQVLAQLDTITCDYLDGKFDVDQYFEKAVECCHFEGHTTGSYMFFLIRDQLGLDAVIESVGDLMLLSIITTKRPGRQAPTNSPTDLSSIFTASPAPLSGNGAAIENILESISDLSET